MKKYLLLPIFLLCVCTAHAQLADGYYRIKNAVTGRYLTVRDNTFTIVMAASDVDLSALVTIRDYNSIVNDPGSILYITKNTEGYVIKAQGTNTYDATGGYYLQLKQNSDGTYKAYASANGFKKYLGDEPDPNNDIDEAWVGTGYTGDTRNWHIVPLNETDNYLGLTPEHKAGDYYYQTLYTSFPYSFASKDVEAYRITKYGQGAAAIEKIEGEIPASTPVIVKTKSADAAANRIKVLTESAAVAGENILKGNYFNLWSRNAQVPYDASTMRVLGKNADGSIGLIKDSGLKYLDRNSAYLPVGTDCADNLKLLTKEEFDKLSYVVGDANGDNKITVSDITAIASSILGSNVSGFSKDAADANKDGKISVSDITSISAYILTGSFPK